MRKLSKSRTEDDTVSSTNGSVTTEVTPEIEAANGGNDATEAESTDTNDKNTDKSLIEDTPPKDPPKKRASKIKNKKQNAVKDDESNDEEEYEVDHIVDSKKVKGKLQYLIRWKGYSASSDTWEPENTLSCPELIEKFKQESETKPQTSKQSLKRKSVEPKKGGKHAKVTPKKAKKSNDFDFEGADPKAEYEVDRILEVQHKKNGKRSFLIHWKGWSNKYDSWEPEDNLNCPELIKKFMLKVKDARETEARSLRVAPETTRRFTLQQQSGARRLSKRSNQRQRVRYEGTE